LQLPASREANACDYSQPGASPENKRCPICDGPGLRLFVKHGYWIRSCVACAHQFTELQPPGDHVERVYGSDYFHGGGSGYPDYLGEAEILRLHGQRYGRLLAGYAQAGNVLDVGAAAGFILQGLQDTGWRGVGIEPNQEMAHFARTQLRLQVSEGALEEFETHDQFDVISMIQVAAHFRDVRKAFQVAAALTRPSGFWLIETWSTQSWTARVLGSHWHEYSPPSTLNYFSPEGLRCLSAQFGFRQVARGRPVKRINGAHAKSLLQYKLGGSRLERFAAATAGFIPDRISIPYPSEDLFWALFRRS
jgi:SAM-dependent methyltransferase